MFTSTSTARLSDEELLEDLKMITRGRDPFIYWRGLTETPERTKLVLDNLEKIYSQDTIAEAINILERVVIAGDKKAWPQGRCDMTTLLTTGHEGFLTLLDPFRLALVKLMSRTKPTRLGGVGCIANCEKMVMQAAAANASRLLEDSEQGTPKISIDELEFDTQRYVYYGVALAIAGNKDEAAKDTLQMALQLADKRDLGQKNLTWANIHLCRVLRRLGDIEASEKLETEIVRYLKKNPNQFSPEVLQDMLLLEGESTTPLLEKINAKASPPKERVFHMIEGYSERTVDTCSYCEAWGIGVKLSKCANCMEVSYCGPICQKKDWGKHKTACREAQARRSGGN